MKKCRSCKELKSFGEFNKSKKNKDGYEGLCKVCRSLSRKKHRKICAYCNEEFLSDKKSTKFCSSSCSGLNRKKRKIVECDNCKVFIEIIPSIAKKNEKNYCNQECRTEHLKELMLGKNNPNYSSVEERCSGCNKAINVRPYKIKNQNYLFCDYECYKNNIGKFFEGENNPNFKSLKYSCDGCGVDVIRKPSEVKGERVFCSKRCYLRRDRSTNKVEVHCSICGKRMMIWNSRLNNSKHIHCSKECANKGNSLRYSGEFSSNWNHEKTQEERLAERKYPAYNEWRINVFQRDRYTCKKCFDDKGGNLVAHHIYNYSEHHHLRTDIENGITLCEKCHKEFHDNYGYTKNNSNQLNEYLNTKPTLCQDSQ